MVGSFPRGLFQVSVFLEDADCILSREPITDKKNLSGNGFLEARSSKHLLKF
jgi:hypothetical protein